MSAAARFLLCGALALGVLAACSSDDDEAARPERATGTWEIYTWDLGDVTDAQIDAYLDAIGETFPSGEPDIVDKWLVNGDLTCGMSDAQLAETVAIQAEVGRERGLAAVRHLCPDRLAYYEELLADSDA